MEIGRGNGSLTNRFSVVGSQLSTTEHRQPKTVFRRLAQLVEHHLHTVGVAGSSPAAPTNLDSRRYCATLGSEIQSFPRGAPTSKTMRFPSGDQFGVRTQFVVEVKSVNLRFCPVETFTVHTFQTPSRRLANAISFSSEDQECGQFSPPVTRTLRSGRMAIDEPPRRS